MTTLNVNTITPAGSTLTLGASGDTVVIADDVKVNTVKDAGGNTLWVSNGSGVLSSVKAGIGGADKLLSTQTASGSASLSFTSGIDSTYKEYVFKFFNINPATDLTDFTFQVNASGQTGFDETMTTTFFYAYHYEDNAGAGLSYIASWDQAQGTAYQLLSSKVGNGADESCAGELHLFNPSSTTYVKNFYTRVNGYHGEDNAALDSYVAGYINTTTAIDEVSFKMSSGNFDGKIKMYGIAS